MAQIKIKLYGDGTLIKTFDQSDLISYNLTTEISNEPLVPIFDLYPSSGTLVIQDKDEALYNLAVNGGLEYNEYVIEIYINNDESFVYKNIATDRPQYSAMEKTLTLSLSDYLDRATTETYKGYDYPLESKNLYEIYASVLCDYLGLDFEEKAVEIGEFYNNIDYNSSLTIKDYLETITVPYPYIQQDTYRNTFKKILTVAMLAMSWTSGTYPTLIPLTGANQDVLATAITTDRVIERFNPAVVLPNKYNSIDIDCKKAIVEYHSNEACYTAENLTKGFQGTSTNDKDKSNAFVLFCDQETNKNTFYGYYKEITVEESGKTSGTAQVYNYNYNNVGGGIILVQKYQDRNKRAISSIVIDETNNKPNYSVTCNVRVSKQKGKFTATYVGGQGRRFYFDKETFTPSTEFVVEGEKTVANYALSSTIKDSAITGLGSTIELSLTFTEPSTEHNISYYSAIDELKSYYSDSTTMFAGYTYYSYFTGTEDNNRFSDIEYGETVEIDGWCYKYEIIPLSLSVTYYGDFSQIVFEEQSYREKRTTSSNVVNNCSIYNGGELLQYTEEGLDNTTTKTIPEQIAETTLDNYRNGLQVATINCIGWDYYGFNPSGNDTNGYIDDYLSHVYNKGTKLVTSPVFSVGELVVPCKDSVKGIPIVRKGKNIPLFQVLKANIAISQGGSITQALTIRELPCDYQIDPLPINITNRRCTLPASNPKTFDGSAPIQILFTPLSGYKRPDTVQVSGCTYTYSKDETVTDTYGTVRGVVHLIKPYANATEINVVIECIPE